MKRMKRAYVVMWDPRTHLVVVDVPLPVDCLCGLDTLIGSDGLLDDLWCDLGADLRSFISGLSGGWPQDSAPQWNLPGAIP